MRIEGTIVCYSLKTGSGIIKEDNGHETYFTYAGVDAPLIVERGRAVLYRDMDSMQDIIEPMQHNFMVQDND